MKYEKGDIVLVDVDSLIEDDDYTVAEGEWRELDFVRGRIVDEFDEIEWGREEQLYIVNISYKDNGFTKTDADFNIRIPESFLSFYKECKSCKSDKVYHDRKERWICPFCN